MNVFSDGGAVAALGGLIIGLIAPRWGCVHFRGRAGGTALTLRAGSRFCRTIVCSSSRMVHDRYSTRETMEVAREAGAAVVGAAAVVDRSGGTIDFGVPSYALVRLDVPAYEAEHCPLCAEGIPVVKPGSRPG